MQLIAGADFSQPVSNVHCTHNGASRSAFGQHGSAHAIRIGQLSLFGKVRMLRYALAHAFERLSAQQHSFADELSKRCAVVHGASCATAAAVVIC
jgi:hypothetical protein